MDEDFGFWKNLVLASAFFVFTPVTLGVSLFSLLSLSKIPVKAESPAVFSNSGIRVYASLPNQFPSVNGMVETGDARPEIVRLYLSRYGSDLEPLAAKLVEEADKNDLDYRLVTAIAQQESNLCKLIPPGSFNCWGWGIHSKGTLGFDSFEEGIETVSKGLREEYLNKGYNSIPEIMSKYTPLSNGSWAEGVSQFMGEME